MAKLFPTFSDDRLRSKNSDIAAGAIVDSLSDLSERVSSWALQQHNEDGSHNTRTTAGLDFVPVGGMIRWPTSTAPTGWLFCNGAAISRTTYPKLFKVLGISSGAGDGSTTFNIPNVANFIILAA